MQERRNSIANALELRLSCTNPSIWSRKTSLETRGGIMPDVASGDMYRHDSFFCGYYPPGLSLSQGGVLSIDFARPLWPQAHSDSTQ